MLYIQLSLFPRYLKPLLTHSNPTLMETMPGGCLSLARLLTSSEQLARHPMMSTNHSLSQDNGLILGQDGQEEAIVIDDKTVPKHM